MLIENTILSWIHDRIDGETLEAAIEDLIRLYRYEKRRPAPAARNLCLMNSKLVAQPAVSTASEGADSAAGGPASASGGASAR